VCVRRAGGLEFAHGRLEILKGAAASQPIRLLLPGAGQGPVLLPCKFELRCRAARPLTRLRMSLAPSGFVVCEFPHRKSEKGIFSSSLRGAISDRRVP
jgi:hypothetical protein